MIEFKNFSKTYDGFQALKNVNLTIPEKKITAVLGVNGAGKTTLLKSVCARHFATSGKIFVNGVDAQEEPEKVKKMTGFLEEFPNLPEDFFVFEYVDFLKSFYRADEKSVRGLIEKCSLRSVLNKKTKELSKGFRQRLNFFQALVSNPEILVLDEPASGLDPEQALNIRELIKSSAKNTTVILSTHLIFEAESLCENCIIMDKGEILLSGELPFILEKTRTQKLEDAFFSLISRSGQ